MTTKTIIRAQGGTAEREVYLDDIQVPDMWHLYSQLEASDPGAAQAIHEVWTLAHDLLRNLKERYVPK